MALLSSTLSSITQQLQMALKRRSLSTVSTLSLGEKLTYQTLNDLSSSNDISESPLSNDISSTTSPKKRLFFKKANVYNFIIRKRAKTELKPSSSITNLVDIGDRTSQDFSSSTQLDGAGKVKIRMIKNNSSSSSKDPKYLIFASFSFGEDKFLKTKIMGRKNIAAEAPKYVYRCLVYSSDWSSGSDWELMGSSENVALCADESNLQFSFINPFEIRYNYEADTTLRFELQRARLADKWMTPNFAQNYSIDKVRRWKPNDIAELGNHYKFVTLALTGCDLNGLANRGYLKSEMNMKSELGPVCSIYLGAELSNKIEGTSPQGPVYFDIQIAIDQMVNDNAKLLSTYTPYRILISRYFVSPKAFISIYKSHPFLLTFSNSHFRVLLNHVQLNEFHFTKLDSMLRFAIIEANTEKWICCGNVNVSSFLQQPEINIPIKESINPEMHFSFTSPSIFHTSNIGFFKILNSHEPKHSEPMDIPSSKNNHHHHYDPNSQSSSSLSASPFGGRSYSIGEKDKPRLSTVSRSESNRDSYSSINNNGRPNSKTEQDLNNNNINGSSYKRNSNHSGIIIEADINEEDDDVETIIVNGHTQAYLMSLLQPNKRILVREIYPDHESITELRQ